VTHRQDHVSEIMATFATTTALIGEREPRRYLWTDAFAVCNYLALHHRTGETSYLDLALRLVDQVHRVLGQHRADDSRMGWISGLDKEEGERHPTAGGLRIGKELGEREPGAPYDERLEWDRDGQYYHYLTKWMHALNAVSEAMGAPDYHRWAVELAQAAHRAFVYAPRPGGQKRMYWKMSTDLSRPLVPSMGQHDPLDGLITYEQLRVTAPQGQPCSLEGELADLASICARQAWATDDPLGIGELLADVYWLAQLVAEYRIERTGLLHALLEDSLISLQAYARHEPLRRPAQYRLAFRELGLSIGLHAVERLQRLVADQGERLGATGAPAWVEALQRYLPLAQQIEAFWLTPSGQGAESWAAHREINMVMLATSLVPEGYLEIGTV
jgi:hypothetical protein